jgi:hypothetical protein
MFFDTEARCGLVNQAKARDVCEVDRCNGLYQAADHRADQDEAPWVNRPPKAKSPTQITEWGFSI